MPRPSPRPRFALQSPLPPAEIRRRLNALLKSSTTLRGIAFDHRVEIAIGGNERHFWSPQLTADVTPEEGGSRLEARFGPDPYVWALYLLSYGAMLLLASWALIFGGVQCWLGQTPTALIAAPVLMIMAGLVYGASFVGQGFGSEQMYLLRTTLTDTVEGTAPEPAAARV